jgi:regulator of RNase E activity RraA
MWGESGSWFPKLEEHVKKGCVLVTATSGARETGYWGSNNTMVSFGGVQVRPGDIVGCDWDGTVVVPIEVAEDVLVFAARIAVDDKKARRRMYDRTGRKPDETVDWEAAAEFFKDLL